MQEDLNAVVLVCRCFDYLVIPVHPVKASQPNEDQTVTKFTEENHHQDSHLTSPQALGAADRCVNAIRHYPFYRASKNFTEASSRHFRLSLFTQFVVLPLSHEKEARSSINRAGRENT